MTIATRLGRPSADDNISTDAIASEGATSTNPASTPHLAETPTPVKRRYAGLILAVVLITQLMIVLDSAIVNIALPDIGSQLHMTSTSLSWIVNAYTLAFGGLLMLGARAGDILSRRNTFLAGLTIFVAASLSGGVAQDQTLLLASRALQGVGAALLAPSALAILMSIYTTGRDRTRAIGYYTVVSASGAAIGLIAGGVLTSVASWRWVFFVNVPIGIVVLAIGARVLPRAKLQRGSVDAVGAVLVTLGMTSLVYGFIRAASDGWGDTGTLAAFVAGVVLLAAFVSIELRVAAPIMPLRLFADRDRAAAYVARLLLVAGSMGTFFFMSQYMQIVLGWSAWQSGLAFLPIPVCVFTASQLVSRVIAVRVSTKVIAAVGTLLSGIGLALMATLGAHSTYADMIPGLVIFGLGNGIAFVPLTTAGLSGVAPADTSVASGLVNVTQQLGGALGLAILVTVFSTAGSNPAVAPGSPAHAVDVFVNGADRGFLVAGGMLAVAFVLVALVMRRPSRAASAAAPVDGDGFDAAELMAIETATEALAEA
ncbi:MFS transporter [Rudaeicoccus suwonensis]|uniref:EmrB/QacA subfamily drug resistance transporter n=1 Tax=Rudaeicoccus suwonensis TaxID=657409 RepID=A0A561E4B6_9MICO|nr:MFS transporter [Rudaeicoccus suwonensis]TWE10455.1 EmrB/QacA subfamily drug resistance transporter [Rudaeicoccus suwonensis]